MALSTLPRHDVVRPEEAPNAFTERREPEMTVYFLATIRIHDDDRYARYLETYDEAFAGTGGAVLAVDDAPTRLEGAPPDGRVVLIRFPDEAAFCSWYDSPAYRRIVVHRHAAAATDALLVHGRDQGAGPGGF